MVLLRSTAAHSEDGDLHFDLIVSGTLHSTAASVSASAAIRLRMPALCHRVDLLLDLDAMRFATAVEIDS